MSQFFAESVLFVITSASREVSARIKARGGGLVAQDREATGGKILQLTKQLCESGAHSTAKLHPLVLASSSKFLGSFASVLSDTCTPDDILGVLSYLHDALSVPSACEAAATSIRSVFLNCGGKLSVNPSVSMGVFGRLIETGMETKR